MDIGKELVQRYLSGAASEEEMETVLNWLAENDENKKYFIEIKQIWIESQLALQKDENKLDESYNRLINRIQFHQNTGAVLKLNNRVKRTGLKFYKAAALILALVSLSVTILLITNGKSKDETVSYSEITIPYGSKSSLVLSDGTKIWLNSGSKLKYPDRFVGDKRAVFLEGEAFFEVTPNKNAMFVVNTSQVNIKVYGTKFNVKCFPDEKSIETTLVSGSIELENIDKNGEVKRSLKMNPHQIVSYSKVNDNFVMFEPSNDEKSTIRKNQRNQPQLIPIQSKTVEIATSWKDNKLTFRSDSLNELTEKLQRWYNVKIDLKANELKKFTFTGTFTTETIEQALKYLQLTTPFNYEIDKNNITINSITKRNI